MSKTDAFNSFGYDYQATRGLWTAEKDQRVLITIWQRIIRYNVGETEPYLYVDLDELLEEGFSRIGDLPLETKHQKRAQLLKRVLNGDAELDVVVLLGAVDNDSGRSFPWNVERNEGFSWRVVRVDEVTGHYRLEARKNWS